MGWLGRFWELLFHHVSVLDREEEKAGWEINRIKSFLLAFFLVVSDRKKWR